MKIVKVVYTTTPEYAEQNSANIKTVMSDLQQLNCTGMFYNTCLAADGKTFTHTAFFKSDEDEQVLIKLPSFIQFQQQLKASVPEAPPKQELLTLVGWSKDIFNS